MEEKKNKKETFKDLGVGDFGYESINALDAQKIQIKIENLLLDRMSIPKVFHLRDLVPSIKNGTEKIVQDDFSRCFESNPPDPWNWNSYLYLLWIIGVFVRYCILFPLRLFILLFGFLLFFMAFFSLKLIIKDKNIRQAWERKLIRMQCSVFVLSWTGVVRYHGVVPARLPNRIYVANHTSMIDVIILQQMNTYAIIGQKHKGWVGFLQSRVMAALGCIWFERGSNKDRTATVERMQAHISNPDANRLLVFPEGTCVNNNFIVQFKRGVFAMDAEICPIAIKYNMIFCDAYWNSRAHGFAMYLVRLMCSWAVVCDVYYLPPVRKHKEETDIDFSNRVKKLIADRIGLQNTDWDGYLKHFQPSNRYVQKRQQAFAESLLQRLTEDERKTADTNQTSDTIFVSPPLSPLLTNYNLLSSPTKNPDLHKRKIAANSSAKADLNFRYLNSNGSKTYPPNPTTTLTTPNSNSTVPLTTPSSTSTISVPITTTAPELTTVTIPLPTPSTTATSDSDISPIDTSTVQNRIENEENTKLQAENINILTSNEKE